MAKENSLLWLRAVLSNLIFSPFADPSRSLPDFAELDLQGKTLPEGIGPEDVKAFQLLYREHCEVCVWIIQKRGNQGS